MSRPPSGRSTSSTKYRAETPNQGALVEAELEPVREEGWFASWKCGLCEFKNTFELGHQQYFCWVCSRDRAVEYKWIYSFKKNSMNLKRYKPFVEPEISYANPPPEPAYDPDLEGEGGVWGNGEWAGEGNEEYPKN